MLRFFIYILLVIPILSQGQNSVGNKQKINAEVSQLLDSANHYFMEGNDKTLDFTQQAITLSKAKKDTLGIIRSLIQKARNEYERGEFPNSIASAFEALGLSEKQDNYRGTIDSYNLLSKIYYKNKNYQKAISLVRKSIRLSSHKNDSAVLAINYEFYSSLYRDIGKIDSSLYYVNRAIIINKKSNDLKSLSSTYNNLGIYYYRTKNLDSSLAYFHKSLQIREALKDYKKITQSINNIGYITLQKGESKKAIDFFKEAIGLCRKHNTIAYLDLSYENLTDAYERTGDNKKALEAYKKLILIKDSITGENTQKAILEAEKKIIIQTQKEKSQLLLSQIESEKRHTNKQFILIITLLFALIMTFFILKTSKKRALETQLEKQKTTAAKAIIDEQEKVREEIARDLHDGVGSSLAGVKLSLSNLQAENKSSVLLEEIEHLEKTYQEIRNISHNLSPISFQKNSLCSTISNYLIRTFPDLKSGICLQCYPENELKKLTYDQKLCVYRIIQELATNIQKHSLATNINFHLTGHKKYLTIMAEDNGKGFDPKIVKQGIGFNNIQKRITLYDGKIEIDSMKGNGTTIIIDIPYKKA